MSVATYSMFKTSHATVVPRNFSCKQHEGRTANFTCTTKSIFYMNLLTISFILERKHLKAYQELF